MIWVTILACVLMIIATGILSVNMLIKENLNESIIIYLLSLSAFYILIII